MEEYEKPEKNNITLIASDVELQDNYLRYWFEKLQTQVNTINERTKIHTRKIKELEKWSIKKEDRK